MAIEVSGVRLLDVLGNPTVDLGPTPGGHFATESVANEVVGKLRSRATVSEGDETGLRCIVQRGQHHDGKMVGGGGHGRRVDPDADHGCCAQDLAVCR
ncbi:MAG: hypothetical protein ACRDZ8_01190 [Acidimicrobiales bacterium]